MAYIKQISAIFLASVMMLAAIICCPLSSVHAEDKKTETEAEAPKELTEVELNAIVQNCSNIKQSLAQLQHVDSRTRTYLGSAYEAVSGRFITPLNLRLVKNGKPATELFRIQNDFTDAQDRFRDGYVNYMREMESLTALDCAAHPKDFYRKLEEVRKKREELRLVTEELSKLSQEQYQAVEALKEKL